MDNKAPAISIITIVMNGEEMLPRAMDSVLAQHFEDFEYIIVNDGSTDGTKAIIDNYIRRDERVKGKHVSENVGRAKARNIGLSVSVGQYILFVDSDDYIPQSSLRDLYEVAKEDNADIVYGRIRSFDQLTGALLPHHYADPLISPEKHSFRLDDNLNLVNDHSIIGRLYRREMLLAHNVAFSNRRKNGEDLLFSFYTSFYSERLSTIPETTVYYYNAGNYMATANEAKICDARDNVLETLEFALSNGSDGLKRRMRRKAAMFAGILDRAQKVYEGQQQKFVEYIATLRPLVDGLPEDILNGLPPYHKRFAKALIMSDFEEAYFAWKERNEYSLRVQSKLMAPIELLGNRVSQLISRWRHGSETGHSRSLKS